MKLIGVVLVVLAITLYLVKKLFLTKKGGAVKAVRLTPKEEFWFKKFPAYELATLMLIIGFVLLVW